MSQGQKAIKTGGIADNGYSPITTHESCGCSSDVAEVIFVKSRFPEASWMVSLPLPCVKKVHSAEREHTSFVELLLSLEYREGRGTNVTLIHLPCVSSSTWHSRREELLFSSFSTTSD
mmetsp:Transcript_27132/g.49034  ORF Transcript_27132/g.49034 Transcript_27132/m.49034 type:complete len:118 (-) Transcript_27132:110-463(-)